MKIFKKQVKSCRECPNYEEHIFEAGGGYQDWCTLSKKEIHPFNKIPEWCELQELR